MKGTFYDWVRREQTIHSKCRSVALKWVTVYCYTASFKRVIIIIKKQDLIYSTRAETGTKLKSKDVNYTYKLILESNLTGKNCPHYKFLKWPQVQKNGWNDNCNCVYWLVEQIILFVRTDWTNSYIHVAHVLSTPSLHIQCKCVLICKSCKKSWWRVGAGVRCVSVVLLREWEGFIPAWHLPSASSSHESRGWAGHP